jgi:hypothetical protein
MKSKNIVSMAQVVEHLAEFHLQYYKKKKKKEKRERKEEDLAFLLVEQERVSAVLSLWYSHVKT